MKFAQLDGCSHSGTHFVSTCRHFSELPGHPTFELTLLHWEREMQKDLYQASAGFMKSFSYYATEVESHLVLQAAFYLLSYFCLRLNTSQAVVTSIPVLWTISIAMMLPVMMVSVHLMHFTHWCAVH